MSNRSSFNKSGSLASGAAVVIDTMLDADYPITVAVQPGSGCTVTVEYKIGSLDYQAWSHGAVTAHASTTFYSPITALRFTRTAGSATDSKYEVI